MTTHCPRDKSSPDYDRLYKLRPLLDHFRTAFKDAETCQIIGEMMIPFHGKHAWYQCLYVQKANQMGILHLTVDLKPGNQYAFFDNLFSSSELMIHLKPYKIIALATLHDRARGCPLPRGTALKKEGRWTIEHFVDKNNGLVIDAWYDNRCVLAISNFLGKDH